MGLDNPKVVDAIGIDKHSGRVVLAILDSWDWTDEAGHLAALQVKLGAYFDFIEMGEVWKTYPDAKGRKVSIKVIERFPIPDSARSLLDAATEMAARFGITMFTENQP